VRIYGAQLHLVPGTIAEAGAWLDEWIAAATVHVANVSTFKEPYRLEGKKTLGLEIAEQLDWQSPDVILYPTGGGVGLLGLWKAFEELAVLGWIDTRRPRPRLVAVQAAGCAPVVRAWEAGEERTRRWDGALTLAAGLRVPGPLAGRELLRALRETRGTALAVADAQILAAVGELAAQGLWVSPEGAALVPALRRLRASGWIGEGEQVVLLNTGTGLVYPDIGT
jgi:threonine synthase